MPDLQPELQLLRIAIEKQAQRTLKSPLDFDYLSLKISETLREQISSTTLKRLWGYIPVKNHPRLSTLSLLARYLKYRDWDDFCRHYLPQESNSLLFNDGHIHVQNLVPGCEIEFSWLPNRHCHVRYEGNFRFHVLEARNAQIHTGACFTAYHFYLNYPLFITQLEQDGQKFVSYIAGSKSGLSYLILKNNNGK